MQGREKGGAVGCSPGEEGWVWSEEGRAHGPSALWGAPVARDRSQG